MGINEDYPAFVFSIENKKYILKLGLTGHYELFPLGHNPEEQSGAVKLFISDEAFIEWYKNNI